MKNFFSFLFLLFFSISYSLGNVICAADSSSDTTNATEKYRKFRIRLDCSSENTFRGRKNTINTPILSPSFKYTAKSGFYTQVNLVNAPTGKTKKVFDELDAGAGWLFNFSDKWDGSISYTHYFFDSQVTRLKAAVQSDLNASIGLGWNILYSQLLFDLNAGNTKFKYKGKTISTNTRDYTVTFANTHNFYIDFNNGSLLTISPEADVLFGTQNFLATYKGKGKLNAADIKYQQQASSFALTAYILYVNVRYKIKKFTVSLSPSYTIPQNVPEGESSIPFFVMSGSIYYTIRSK